jgi:hypothetical protein
MKRSSEFAAPFQAKSTPDLGGGLLDQGLEGVGVVNRELGEHLAVHLDSLLVQAINQLAVPNAIFSASGGNPRDPKAAKIALLLASVAEGVLPGLHDLFVGTAEDVLLPAEIARGLGDDLFVALVAH